ncbi:MULTISPECIES: phosphatidylserine/phosphatidylglycerophosphate/cardiolipin synthase family protein [unclassified Mesorhizobium]|uniref:phospholipase D-like domain-containing protein n=1 Tax=unclassified Mesorhizobium TaxID=325217 RepID=UPI001FE1365A|nr:MULTISPECIES: phospholipase D-like domain-containing protein [unclassified Mesorhizobium]MCT2580351.1 phospholipase D-like domain-containing protein [Mesorhizobium sp. P13.3]MDF3169293.1 phospholipase D-like domain-containing protein [Mesorhizobium sp. P16.1]MDF3177089.1 phospholipase D-like domain-containing protein [Mesorhizobium sp. P17.1]MDF3186208.1 phospholipase D-like domain-containing protein [Mesorhizobium sp. ICCV3110.1]MDG4900010.1 phospholipase D-like domain-containing protein [
MAVALVASLVTLLAINLIPETRVIRTIVPHRFDAADPQFARSMSSYSQGQMFEANAVQTLVNGDEIFPAMLQAIRSARKTINMETYIYWSGSVGYEFATSLAAKAREGVEVRVLVDWLGSLPFDEKLIQIMTSAGVRFERYRPIHWYTLDRVNNRTHRKLLIVDGRVAFTGGVGIADNWLGDARNPNEWRDTHYQIEGPAVPGFQAAFAENWLETVGETLQGENFYLPPEAAGALRAQLILSSQPNGSENMELMMLAAIAAAKDHLRIGMAYFLPDDIALQQILDARKRGVAVDVIVPNSLTDVPIVRKASRYFWGKLLEAGVRIYEFQPTMYHPKLLIVDDVWASFGSTNLDQRSLRLNDEATLNVYGKEFARTQIDLFNEDLKRSRQISLAEWRSRPMREKFTDWLASTLHAQL